MKSQGAAGKVQYGAPDMQAIEDSAVSGERVMIQVHALAHGGAGIGRPVDPDDTKTWLVAGALPGERILASRAREERRLVRGELATVVEAGPLRVTPPCGLAPVCGGCNWQHVDPAQQLELKRAIVAGQLRRVTDRVVAAPSRGAPLGYRRRARLHYARDGSDGLLLGFFRARSREVIDAPDCPVLDGPLRHAFAKVRALAPHLPRDGEIFGLSDGARAVLGVPGVRADAIIEEAARALLDGILVGVELRGGRRRVSVGAPTLDLDGAALPPVTASPFVFAQAQEAQNAALVEHVARVARGRGARVLELHAGAGNFTRALAREAVKVLAIDEDREAIGRLQALSPPAPASRSTPGSPVEAALALVPTRSQLPRWSSIRAPRGLGWRPPRTSPRSPAIGSSTSPATPRPWPGISPCSSRPAFESSRSRCST
ncbi:MAG: hypothetical protein R3A51_17530 [Nannocystaceae bacterium]